MEKKEALLGNRVFHILREQILAGVYVSGEELKEISLGRELGVSRTPVREALHQLELEGLIEILPNRGARVIGISKEDMEDIYMMRSHLEGLAARLAARRMTKEELAQLEEIMILTEFHLNKPEDTQIVQYDGRFHRIIYHGAKSRMLERVLGDFHHYVKAARVTSLQVENRAKESFKEHQAIFEAIRNKDEDLAERLSREHVHHVMENLAFHKMEK